MGVTVYFHGADTASREEIFITGHGGWLPDALWVTMPKGTTLYFYTEASRSMSQYDAERLVAGEITEAEAVIGEFKTTQNVALFPETGLDEINDTIEALSRNSSQSKCSILRVEGGGVCLSDLLTLDEVKGRKIHWCCCRTSMLKELPSKPSDLKIDFRDFNKLQALH